jgi:hypothetical protein
MACLFSRWWMLDEGLQLNPGNMLDDQEWLEVLWKANRSP